MTQGFPGPADFEPMPIDGDDRFVVRFLNSTSNKPLHLGHLRNVVLGEATVSSLRVLGLHAFGHCVLEDTGRFMTEAMASVRALEAAGQPLPPPGPNTDHWVGERYAEWRAARALRRGKSGEAAASTDYEAEADEADDLMRALLSREPDALSLRARVRALALAGQADTLRRLGASVDFCDLESTEDDHVQAFVARCETAGLLQEDGERRVWHPPYEGPLKILNKAGLPEESARLLCLNARAARTSKARYRTVVFAGSEWRASMRLYAKFLHAAGIDLQDRYLPTFYGMVTLGGKKMASSARTGVLVDDVLDQLTEDAEVVSMAAGSPREATAEELASIVLRAFMLSRPRTEEIAFTAEALADRAGNPGWQIARAWAGSQRQRSDGPSASIRRRIRQAAEQRSYERLTGLAADLARNASVDDPAGLIAFEAAATAIGIRPHRPMPDFLDLPSFLADREAPAGGGASRD